jgi:hypothetical protein
MKHWLLNIFLLFCCPAFSASDTSRLNIRIELDKNFFNYFNYYFAVDSIIDARTNSEKKELGYYLHQTTRRSLRCDSLTEGILEGIRDHKSFHPTRKVVIVLNQIYIRESTGNSGNDYELTLSLDYLVKQSGGYQLSYRQFYVYRMANGLRPNNKREVVINELLTKGLANAFLDYKNQTGYYKPISGKIIPASVVNFVYSNSTVPPQAGQRRNGVYFSYRDLLYNRPDTVVKYPLPGLDAFKTANIILKPVSYIGARVFAVVKDNTIFVHTCDGYYSEAKISPLGLDFYKGPHQALRKEEPSPLLGYGLFLGNLLPSYCPK